MRVKNGMMKKFREHEEKLNDVNPIEYDDAAEVHEKSLYTHLKEEGEDDELLSSDIENSVYDYDEYDEN